MTTEIKTGDPCVDNDGGPPTPTFNWSMVGILAAIIAVTIVLGFLFT